MFDDIRKIRTTTLRRFIEAEGPAGSGRVTGLSIEPDGVFIYTDSAAWCDDSGAGTFRGDSETAAVRAFRERVRKAEAHAADVRETELKANRAPELAVTDAAFDVRESAIAPHATYATVWESDAPRARPVATVYRPQRGDTGTTRGLFHMVDTEGRAVAFWGRMPTLGAVRRALAELAAQREAVRTMGDSELAEAETDAEEAALAAGRRVADLAEREAAGAGGLYDFRARAATRQAVAYARFTAARAERERREDAAAREAFAAAQKAPAAPLHFCPRCEAETAAPGLCSDCEELAEHGSPAAVDIRREELAARRKATGFRAVMGQGGAFPLWAVAAERAASAIDDSLELRLDIRDPFAPGWADTEELGPLWG